MNSTLMIHVISSLPWYLVRAFGLIAAGLLVLLMISGIGLITGYTFRFWPPVKAWVVHKAFGISFVVALIGYIVFLLFDQYQRYTFSLLLVPFLGSIWLTFGILAFYLLIIIVISSLLIIDSKKYLWKIIHLLGYAAMVFVFFHALKMGTDLQTGWLRDLWIIFGLILLVATISRLWRLGTTKS